jgi:hypothetical protein
MILEVSAYLTPSWPAKTCNGDAQGLKLMRGSKPIATKSGTISLQGLRLEVRQCSTYEVRTVIEAM